MPVSTTSPAPAASHPVAGGPAATAVRAGRRAAMTSAVTGVLLLAGQPAFAAAPTPGQVQPPGTEGLSTMLGWGGWLVSFVCVAGLLVVAAMMALKHRRGEGGGEAMGSLGWVLGACVLGAAAGPLANALI